MCTSSCGSPPSPWEGSAFTSLLAELWAAELQGFQIPRVGGWGEVPLLLRPGSCHPVFPSPRQVQAGVTRVVRMAIVRQACLCPFP